MIGDVLCVSLVRYLYGDLSVFGLTLDWGCLGLSLVCYWCGDVLCVSLVCYWYDDVLCVSLVRYWYDDVLCVFLVCYWYGDVLCVSLVCTGMMMSCVFLVRYSRPSIIRTSLIRTLVNYRIMIFIGGVTNSYFSHEMYYFSYVFSDPWLEWMLVTKSCALLVW